MAEHEIYESIEHRLKSKIGQIFVNEKILEEHSVKIYKIDPYFRKNCEKQIQVDNNDKKYILFRTDVYFSEYCLAIEIDETSHTDRDLFLNKKDKRHQKKKFNCTFIRFNISKENFDVDYEVSKTQMFISEFKDNKIKERDDKIKERDDKIKKQTIKTKN